MVKRFDQDPSAARIYKAEFRAACANIHTPGTEYTLDAVVQPKAFTGFQYRSTTAGYSASKETRWPIVAGQTVTDGTVVWRAEPITAASLSRTLQSAVWSAQTGLTIGAPTTSGTTSSVIISGGVAGQSYEIACAGTMSDGETHVVVCVVTVTRPARERVDE